MTDQAVPQTRGITGTHVLFAVIAFFAVIIAVNIVFIVLATGSFTGEDVPKAYLQGVDYNKTLEARAAQRQAGWQASVSADRDADGTVHVVLDIKDAANKPLKALRVDGVLRRPTQLKLDKPLQFGPDGPGTYRAAVSNVEPGSWDIVVTAGETQSDQFEARRRVWLP